MRAIIPKDDTPVEQWKPAPGIYRFLASENEKYHCGLRGLVWLDSHLRGPLCEIFWNVLRNNSTKCWTD